MGVKKLEDLPQPLPADIDGNPVYWAASPRDPGTQLLHPNLDLDIDQQQAWHSELIQRVRTAPSGIQFDDLKYFTDDDIIKSLKTGAFNRAGRNWRARFKTPEEKDKEWRSGRTYKRSQKVSTTIKTRN
jgi:hypothetical protein